MKSEKAKKSKTILETWGISAEYLTEVVSGNPSLRGMMVGYIAERKLHDVFESSGRVSALRKDDDHDRTRKGDLVIAYKGFEFKIEVKSLQTNQVEIFHKGQWIPRAQKIRVAACGGNKAKYRYVPNPEFLAIPYKERLAAQYRGAVQCDASDKRDVTLRNGKTFSTTCLLVGEFDILAAGLFGFRECWDFGFALNRSLPLSRARGYPPKVQEQLLATLMPVTWPLSAPYATDPFALLDQLVREKRRKKP
jgi:hypothetical protein